MKNVDTNNRKTGTSLFKTSDLSLCAYMITKGFKISGLTKEKTSVFIEFWISENDNPLSDFLSGELVSAKEYAANIKEVKRLAMSYSK